METKHQNHDVSVERVARAKIRAARQLLAQTTDPKERESIEAVIAALDGSWISTETVDRPDVLTEAEGIERDAEAARESQRQAIRDELAANDAKAMRALFAGDTDRIAEHNARQAELRAQLQAI